MIKRIILGSWILICSFLVFILGMALSWGFSEAYNCIKSEFLKHVLAIDYLVLVSAVLLFLTAILIFFKNKTARITGIIATDIYFLFVGISFAKAIIIVTFPYKDPLPWQQFTILQMLVLFSPMVAIGIINLCIFLKMKRDSIGPIEG